MRAICPTRQRRNLLLSAALLLGMSVCLSDAIRCYVCGPKDEGFSQTCDGFASNVTRYEHQCPEKYFGCSTHTEGTEYKRECVHMRINDCKKANNIEYCYCFTNLCNGIKPQLQETDDEDILDQEGSGEGTPAPSGKDDINVIIQDVGGNSVETIETKTSGARRAAFASTILSLLPVLRFIN